MRAIASQPGRLWRFVLSATREICMRIVLSIILFIGYLACSMIVYAAMRQLLVPQKTHVLPIHLYFNPQCIGDSSGDSHVFEQKKFNQQHFSRQMRQDTTCRYPFAEFLLAGGERLLTPGHTYTVAVELEMPESPRNENLGMFMINLTLYSNSGRSLVTSIRPAILHYKTSLLHTFSTFFYALPLVLGLTEQKQSVSTVMIDSYQESYFTDGSIYARVTVMTHSIQLYSAKLTFDADFTGITYYLYRWPISMAVIIISGLFFTVSMVTLMMWLRQAIERVNRFQYHRRHFNQRMNLRAPEGLDPIPEEEEAAVRIDQQYVEDISTTTTSDHSSVNDIPDNVSTISSATEIPTCTSDTSEANTDIEDAVPAEPPATNRQLLIHDEEQSTLRYRSN